MTTRYSITYAPRVQRDLRKLPEKMATASVEFIRTTLSADPYRIGKPLTLSWEGYYAARRAEWRIIYRIDDHQILVEVVTIAHRADSYRPR
ncbi:MAG: type II toxin-antitoxin system RelE family toxin [Pseudonocardiales bacterium]